MPRWRDGTLKPGHPTFRQVEWYRALEGRDARLSRGVVALDFSNPASLEALQKEHPAGRITLEPHEYDGQRYVVKMSASPVRPVRPQERRAALG